MKVSDRSGDDAPGAPAGLVLGARNKAEWDQPETRRAGLRSLHRLHRYGLSLRAARVLPLHTRHDFRLHDLEAVRWYLSHPFFTGLAVLRGTDVLLEQYSRDFAASGVHSIQSITKTSIHLMAGRLIEQGKLDPSRAVASYLPEIGTGYALATVQDLLDMAVVNDYTEDYYDPGASVGLLEDAHGWRLIGNYAHIGLREFLAGITGAGVPDASRMLHYKTANTDIVAWICERVCGRDLRQLYIELVEAAGVEATVYLSTDRAGTPFAGGGLHMTLRDLARYGLLLARGGRGIGGIVVGSPAFRDATRVGHANGTASLLGSGRYRNFVETEGTWLGHNGYGGQWLMAYPESEIIVACLSGVSDDGGHDWRFIARLAAMGETIAALLGNGS